MQGNVSGRTRVSLELPGQHYVAYEQLGVTAGFLADLAAEGVPTVPDSGYAQGYYSSLSCGAVRWDVPPTRFAR